MARHDVPTADFLVCDSPAEAVRVLDSGRFGFPVVVKADGLAAGKGVVVAGDLPEARAAVHSFMVDRIFGESGDRVLIERCLAGVEASFFVLSDGRNAVPLVSAQDHKRVFDDDRGPNTGGMGAFSPSRLVTPALADRVMRDIVAPTLSGMAADGCPYAGILYVGLMLTDEGPQVIEYNVRFGDPEAQVILPAIDDDLLPWFAAAAAGRLPNTGEGRLRLRPEPHVGVVLASRGYPGAFETGRAIDGLDEVAGLDDVFVFHAGTARRDGRIVTAGGRVLTVVARGNDYLAAIHRAYHAASRISFEGMHCRRDIGRAAV
jgi:phosphoribosylamine--glycine ligase